MRTKAAHLLLVSAIVLGSLRLAAQQPTDPTSVYPSGTGSTADSTANEPSNRSTPTYIDSDVDNTDAQRSDIQNALRRTRNELTDTEKERMAGEPPVCPGPRCPKMVREAKTEFQKFVFTTTGERLPIYGRNLFETSPSTFAPVDHIPVPAEYVVGPGDELIIRAWGQADFNARVTVDRNGQIYLPRVGTLNVSGIRYDRLTDYMKNEIGRIFRNFELNVTLGHLRSIQVYVVGQARRPGTYTISSLSTLSTALFASGGPNASGSMRSIQLKRKNQVVAEFDVYDLLSKGDKSKDSDLLPGDVIYIPAVGKQVAVIGSVNLPAIFEINDKTTVGDQIAAAGGLSTTADGTSVVIERIDGHKTRSIEQVKLDETGLSRILRDGDIVRVSPISPRVEGSVILRGSVAVPGRYPWHEGMRISDLIPSKEVLIKRDYWMRQSRLSRGETGWRDPEPDPDQPDQADEANPNSQNAKSKRDDSWSDGKLTSDRADVVHNPSEINWDYAVVQRLSGQDLSSELLTFDLGNAIENPTSKDNLILRAGDVVTVFAQTDLAVPAEKRTKFVWIEGEVKAPGIYRVAPSETLRDIVERAGGLTPSAYLFASEFRRLSTKKEQQKEMDRLIESAERDLRTRARVGASSLTAEDKIAAQEELQYERSAIDKLRTIQVTGRIVLRLKPTDKQVSDLPPVKLEDGDQFLIPAVPETVGVVGAVYNQNSFFYEERNTVSEYLNQAGGGTREADKSQLFIVRANGSVVSKQNHRPIWSGSFEGNELYPGDAVVMPERIKTTNVLKGLRDWSQVFAQFALGVAALKTIAP